MFLLKSLTHKERRNNLESVGSGLSCQEEFSVSTISEGVLMQELAGSGFLEESFKKTSSDVKGYWASGN